MSEFTDDQICNAIADCIKARDFETVVSLMKVLALQAPAKADALLGYIKLLSFADKCHASTSGACDCLSSGGCSAATR